MADDTPPRQMSLIPYPYSNGEVVLRRGNAVVVYDAQSRQLSVRDSSDQAVELAECPYCHRPLRDEHPRRDASEEGHGRPGSNNGFNDRPFVDPEYFEMLAESRRPSPAGSAAPTTPRFVPPALRSGRSREVSGSHDPPTGAEFMGSVPSSAAGQGISKSAFSPGYFEQFFREIRELGRGGNGVVMLVEHVLDRVSLGQFACKRVPVGDDHDWLEKVLVEVRLLQNVVHTNLVRYHWVWLEDYQQGKFTPSIPCLWMLQDYCNGGDLHSCVLGPKKDDEETKEMMKDRVRRNSKVDAHSAPPQEMRGPSKLTFGEIFQFFQDIASGLHHLHKKGYVHRDLKPSNCLLHHDGNSTRVLISDFGEVQEAVAKRASTGATGTISYCAPEILKKDGKGAFGQFTPKSDIFSLGMIVYFMCFGRLPYSNADDINEENEDLDELRAEIMKWPGFDEETRARPDLPEKLYKYLKRLLSVDPNDRPSTEEILSMSKGSSGIAEMASSLVEENSSRVSAIDTPKKGGSPRPPQNRKPQQFRPGLSNLGRQVSADTVRPTSPKRRSSGSGSSHHSHSRGHSRPTSPTDASLIKRPRHVDLPPPSPNDERRQSPRLMLPPPPPGPPTFGQKAMRLMYHHNVRTSLRMTIFLGKVLSLTLPCSPYAASAWLLYPLLALAALDLGFLNLHLREKLLLLMIHFGVLTFAARRGTLCQSGGMVWDDYSSDY